jgi:ubiquinol-cytochrome c reductase cytochrome c1 subunit
MKLRMGLTTRVRCLKDPGSYQVCTFMPMSSTVNLKLSLYECVDKIPGPYRNEEEARAANNGAYPPDLSLYAFMRSCSSQVLTLTNCTVDRIVKARHYGIDYIVALLTGYMDAPAGKVMLSGLHYNPYFPGGAIAMAKQLNDGQVDYEDGTPSTEGKILRYVLQVQQYL